jgi:imidazolonepropionase-like amidohydrolase
MNRRLLSVLATTAAGLAIWPLAPSLRTLAQNRPAQAGQQKPLVLKGGLLIDGAGGAPLKDAVIVLSGGRIQSIGPQASAKIPADATVIDTSGKTILPGLINSHVHMRNFLAPLFLYWGVTTVGDLGNPTGWTLAYRDAIAKGRIVGPSILAAGAKFDPPLKPGDPMVTGDLSGFSTFLLGNSARVYVSDEASAASAIARVKKQGVDAVKLYTRMNPELMRITTQAAHRNGLPVFAHYTSAATRQGLFTGTDEILDTGIDVHVHLYGLVKATAPKEIRDRIARGEAVQAWHLLDTGKFPPLIEKMVQVKMFLNPTLGAQFKNASKYRDEFDRLNTGFLNGPIVANFPEPLVRGRFAAAFTAPRGPGGQELAEGYKRAGQFVKEFVAKGGKVIAGDDTGAGAGSGTPGLAQHLELRMLEEIGLTPMQAIQSATLWSAEAWGKSKEVGTLEVGKRADLLILNRNPLEDMAATTDIYRVIEGGAVIDRDALAKWQETLPRPGAVIDPLPGYPNTLMHIPFIDEISPEWLTATQKSRSEILITGENFSNENLVLINDRLLPAKAEGGDQLRISIPPGLLKKPGTYPLVVVQPGSAGGVSNTFYVIVTSD